MDVRMPPRHGDPSRAVGALTDELKTQPLSPDAPTATGRGGVGIGDRQAQIGVLSSDDDALTRFGECKTAALLRSVNGFQI